MRCLRGSSTREKEELSATIQIEKNLKDDRDKRDKEVKLLLLGSGESGKSTIAKQMKILFQGPYGEDEMIAFTFPVWANCLTVLKAVVGYTLARDVSVSASSQKCVDCIKYTTSVTQDTAAEMRAILPTLFKDPAISKTLSDIQRRKFKVPDSAPYFLDNMDRIFEENYVPTVDDILRTRLKTLGIYEFRFTHEGTTWVLVDVGGQRSERRKWIHCFEDVTAILFCVALNEYDLTLEEDGSVLRMHESLKLFHEMCTSSYFTKASVILLLNKEDLFREKVAKVDLKCCFPDYRGGKNYDSALQYIKLQFRSERVSYTHVSTAIDIENVRFVMQAALATILERVAEEACL